MKSLNYHFVDKCSATTVMDIAQLFGAKEHSHVNVSTLREVGEIEWSEAKGGGNAARTNMLMNGNRNANRWCLVMKIMRNNNTASDASCRSRL